MKTCINSHFSHIQGERRLIFQTQSEVPDALETAINPQEAETRDPPALPPQILSGKEMYDTLMRGIEPELLSENLPKLKEQYSNETPEQQRERGARYDRAFAEYDKRFQVYVAELHAKVVQYRKQALHGIEERDRHAEGIKMQEKLGSYFGTTT